MDPYEIMISPDKGASPKNTLLSQELWTRSYFILKVSESQKKKCILNNFRFYFCKKNWQFFNSRRILKPERVQLFFLGIYKEYNGNFKVFTSSKLKKEGLKTYFDSFNFEKFSKNSKYYNIYKGRSGGDSFEIHSAEGNPWSLRGDFLSYESGNCAIFICLVAYCWYIYFAREVRSFMYWYFRSMYLCECILIGSSSGQS